MKDKNGFDTRLCEYTYTSPLEEGYATHIEGMDIEALHQQNQKRILQAVNPTAIELGRTILTALANVNPVMLPRYYRDGEDFDDAMKNGKYNPWENQRAAAYFDKSTLVPSSRSGGSYQRTYNAYAPKKMEIIATVRTSNDPGVFRRWELLLFENLLAYMNIIRRRMGVTWIDASYTTSEYGGDMYLGFRSKDPVISWNIPIMNPERELKETCEVSAYIAAQYVIPAPGKKARHDECVVEEYVETRRVRRRLVCT